MNKLQYSIELQLCSIILQKFDQKIRSKIEISLIFALELKLDEAGHFDILQRFPTWGMRTPRGT